MVRKRKTFTPRRSVRYRKPIKRSRRRRENPEIGGLLRKTIGLIILGSIIYFFFFAQTFALKNLSFAEGTLLNPTINEKITAQLQPYLGQHLLKLDDTQIATEILENFPELEVVEVDKKYPNSLKIDFKKHPLTANIINESSSVKKTFIINSAGNVVKQDFESPNLPYIHLTSDQPLNPAETIIEPDTLKYILESQSAFQERFGIGIIQAVYKPIPRELHLVTEKDFTVWLDIQIPYDDQFKKLKKAMPKLDINNAPLDYIDLRIAVSKGDRIIYKLK